jgi:hypothetical protein
VAEPWADDLAALGEHTRRQLRSLDATRASLSARTKETKMRFFKTHPALAALIVLVSLGLFAPLAYAVVQRVWLTVDSNKSAPEIENDVRQQLDKAGVNAQVHAEKSDDGGRQQLSVSVWSEDPNADIDMHVTGSDDEHTISNRRQISIEADFELTPDQSSALHAAVKAGVTATDSTDSDALAARIRDALAAAGFHDVDVTVAGENVTITVKSPPTP